MIIDFRLIFARIELLWGEDRGWCLGFYNFRYLVDFLYFLQYFEGFFGSLLSLVARLVGLGSIHLRRLNRRFFLSFFLFLVDFSEINLVYLGIAAIILDILTLFLYYHFLVL